MKRMLKDYQKVYRLLEDKESRDIYMNRLNWLISEDWKYVSNMVTASMKEAVTYGIGKIVKEMRDSMPKDRKFVLYGAGKLAEYVIPFWRCDERFAGFCCNTRDKQINGYLEYSVMSPEQLLAQKELSVVVCTTTFREEILKILRDGGYPEDQIFAIPDFQDTADPEQYFDPSFMKFEDEEVFVDVGCLDLGTSLNLRKYCRHVKKVYAFEPESKAYQNCLARKEQTGFTEAEILPYGAWSERTTLHFSPEVPGSSKVAEERDCTISAVPIDEVVDSKLRVTMIKMDVEGSELEALKGAKNTIQRDKPKLAICIYHKPEDMTEIPLYIKELVPEYKLYVRLHDHAAGETVLYAVIPRA